MPQRRRSSPDPARRLVTLTSDLGAAYAAQMKAVLARSLDPSRVVELSHDLRPHDIVEGAFLLRAMAGGFPPGTVHLAVVDPGVGGRRAPLIVTCSDGSLLVGPDNGLLIPLAEQLGRSRTYRIAPNRLRLVDRVGTTFDGRDLFAPAAARLALGARPAALGLPAQATPLELPTPVRTPRGAHGVVLHADRFGNAITNIPTGWVPVRSSHISARWGTRRVTLPWVRSYEAVALRRPLALGSSFGTVELAVHRGSAVERLGLPVGRGVRLAWAGATLTTGK